MNPDFWHARWRKGSIGWHEDDVNAYLRAHWPGLAVQPSTGVLVPLCGKSLDLLWLARQGLHVTGVEISRLAVDAFFAENGLEAQIINESPFLRYTSAELEILCGDFFQLQAARLAGTNAVFDRGSLIAMPPMMRPRYSDHLRGLLGDPCKGLLITLEYDQTEMPGPPFSVDENEVRRLYEGRFQVTRLSQLDVLAAKSRFRQRGLTRLLEKVYRLTSL